jgi:2,4-dienoyl-CoA reductase-like NADH-dependent reductase (Old Yellow Enzyme family)/thioredoxin reductase
MKRKIFEPIEIKGMKLKNRIGFAPFVNIPGGEEGFVTDQTIRWFEERAKGGLGFIMTGALGVSTTPAGGAANLLRRMTAAGRVTWVGVTDDKYIAGLAKIAEVIHSYGVKIGVQIVAGGPLSGQGPSPSPFPDETHPKYGQFDLAMSRILPVDELSVEQIEQFEDDFAAAAARVKAAGFDCVMLHCAHGGATLCCSFISPFYNRRTDKYGGDWEGRLLLPVETIKKMREAVGEDFPIFARIDADELLGDRGITVNDATKYIVPALEKAGVDCFDVSQGSIMHSPQGITIPLYYPRGCFIHHAAAVKKVTRLPVIGVGNIFDLDMAERFLQEGKADVIYMGRQVTCDPETPKKYFEGRPEDIRHCIGCIGGCGRPCTINYDIQDEPIPLTQAEKPKKVLVIGGGVGGMEAARIAALRGHTVTLMEKDSHLGGMVSVLALNPLTAEFGNIVTYLSTQMRKLGVDVRICKEATIANVEELKPDVVILATGSSPTIPEIAQGKLGVMTHSQASKEKRAIGQKVVVWGIFGAELAITLAEDGKDVVLMGRAGEGSLGSDVSSARRFWLLRKLTDFNLVRATPEGARVDNPEVLYHVEVEDISNDGIRVKVGGNEARTKVIPYDTLIISQRFGERKANDSLFDELQGKVPEVYKIGDCAEVRGMLEAIHGANEVVRKI